MLSDNTLDVSKINRVFNSISRLIKTFLQQSNNEKDKKKKAVEKNSSLTLFSVFFVNIFVQDLIDCREELLLLRTTSTGVPQGSLLDLPLLPFLTLVFGSCFTSHSFFLLLWDKKLLPSLSILWQLGKWRMGTDSFISSEWSSSVLPSITHPIGCLSTTSSSALTRLCCCFSFFKTCASPPVSTDTAVTAMRPHYNHGLILPHHWDFYSVLVSHPRSCRLNCPQCPFISPVTLLLQSVHGCTYWKNPLILSGHDLDSCPCLFLYYCPIIYPSPCSGLVVAFLSCGGMTFQLEFDENESCYLSILYRKLLVYKMAFLIKPVILPTLLYLIRFRNNRNCRPSRFKRKLNMLL